MRMYKKILFLSGTPGLLKNTHKYNGVGWIASLQREIMLQYSEKIQLSLAFITDRNYCTEYEGVKYYGIKTIRHTFCNYSRKEKLLCLRIKEVIDDCHPDLILCFGTENGLGLACTLTDIPVVIHIQGILNPYYEAWMPQGLSWLKWLLGNKSAVLTWMALKKYKKREMRIFQSCKYFLGRTEWDRQITNLLAPQARYFYCGEILRSEIYYSRKTWLPQQNHVKRIVSIISSSIYKGGDVILRCAKILKQNVSYNFTWEVYGVSEMKMWEKITGLKHDKVNVVIKGVINAKQLVDVVTSADVYVHPSYIENSPNTVCEAQILGIPVIATNTGGTSSLMQHLKTGILIPTNAPYFMASYIKMIIENVPLAEKLGNAGRKIALDRHNPQKIVLDLFKVFEIV